MLHIPDFCVKSNFASTTQSNRHSCVRYLGMWVSQAQRILFHWFLSDSLYIKLVSICSIAGHENPYKPVWKKNGNVYPDQNALLLLYFTKQNKNKLKLSARLTASSFPGPFPYPWGGGVGKRPWERGWADRRLIQIPNGRLFIATSTTHNSLQFSSQATVPCQQNNNYC